jgi:DNA end-binding protein Ku
MARAIWTGSVAFGLVNVPVGLYAATEDRTVHFNQFQAGTTDRIRYKRVNERTGREVKLADIVRGHEVSKDDYVLVTDEELAAVDPAGRGRSISLISSISLRSTRSTSRRPTTWPRRARARCARTRCCTAR